MAELKPCPFCGGEATRTDHTENYDGSILNSITCKSCGAGTLSNDDEPGEKWNTRAPDPRILELENELRIIYNESDDQWIINRIEKALEAK